MEIKERFLFTIILCLILSACAPRLTDRVEYRLDDVVYRKMRLTFYNDGRVSLGNSSAWRIGFSSYGNWNFNNGDIIIVLGPSNLSNSVSEVAYPKQGDTVNLERLFTDPLYSTFPVIRTDTVRFSDDYKIAYLKGFQFEHHPSTANLSRLINKR